jgi:DNA-binding MarR family transcriptional regulator
MNEDLVERGLELYRTALRVLHERGAPAWYEVELSVAQLKALFTLVDAGSMPIGGVAARLSIGLPAASSLVDRLVDQGLVKRREDPLDRRRTLAEPTAAGEGLAQRLRHGSREALRAWLEQMDRDDLDALVRGLAAMVSTAMAPIPAAAISAPVASTVLHGPPTPPLPRRGGGS